MKSPNLSSLASTAISIRASLAETSFRAGGPFGLPVVLVNEGNRPIRWSGRNPLNLSYRWLGEKGVPIERDGRRTIIPNESLGQGERVDLKLMGAAPDVEGHFTLLVSLVLENVHWACDIGPSGWTKIDVHVPAAQTWPTYLGGAPGGRALRGALLAAEIARSLDAGPIVSPPVEGSARNAGRDPTVSEGGPVVETRLGSRMRAWWAKC